MKAAAIILAGGISSRMGTNKALLKINEKTNIERIIEQLKLLFDDLILVTNDAKTYEFLDVQMVQDQYPGMGPLAGVHAGLNVSNYDVNLVVACDMPFISSELAEALLANASNYDAVVPVINGKQHPLFAVYQKQVAKMVEERIQSGQLRMKHLLDDLNVLYLTEKELATYSPIALEKVFFNMNHPEEYVEAKKWAESDVSNR
ncbi:molybdenum cofactor guanylyltransferase [Neobacillus cucumis]|uniref:molybdenum cofactor guanylyltransferase n=1 Tax=Neobacillus cucumis TaxID=1740721 RepID=UPI001964CF29|nr:molybdenum cofactor guanylyltransferase [Neobacillus cucumis]MBM7653938.1 molybdopterin-guanine dinucleotide biosynthesis protein A [Neobacillus cucumis]